MCTRTHTHFHIDDIAENIMAEYTHKIYVSMSTGTSSRQVAVEAAKGGFACRVAEGARSGVLCMCVCVCVCVCVCMCVCFACLFFFLIANRL